jgi:hypothetical protein
VMQDLRGAIGSHLAVFEVRWVRPAEHDACMHDMQHVRPCLHSRQAAVAAPASAALVCG